MKLYVHREGQAEPELVEIDETLSIEMLIEAHGATGDGAWVEDGDELIVETKVVEVLRDRTHIYVGRCREVAVRVRFGGPDKQIERRFRPSATIQTVYDWAAGPEGFNLPPDQRATHGLFVPGSQTPLDSSEHIGVIAKDCEVLLDLAAKHRHQG